MKKIFSTFLISILVQNTCFALPISIDGKKGTEVGQGEYEASPLDTDGDGIPNDQDDDVDGDGIPNEDDNDTDGDGVDDIDDNCPIDSNPGQDDLDGDGLGDVCDDDIDGDGIPNSEDDDMDNDGISNNDDNCIDKPNEDQKDSDLDGIGDVCDVDNDYSIAIPFIDLVTTTSIDTTPGKVEDKDGVRDIKVAIYSDSGLINRLGENQSGDFSGLIPETTYYITTIAQVKNGITGSWEDIESNDKSIRTSLSPLDGKCSDEEEYICEEGNFENSEDTETEFKWFCRGINNGKDDECSLDIEGDDGSDGDGDDGGENPVDGLCSQASSGATLETQPDQDSLCEKGNPSDVIGDGPWTWTCNGLNGGDTTDTCTAFIPENQIDGLCSQASSGATLETQPDQDSLCEKGNPSDVIGDGPWTWTCSGLNGGDTTDPCTAYKEGEIAGLECGNGKIDLELSEECDGEDWCDEDDCVWLDLDCGTHSGTTISSTDFDLIDQNELCGVGDLTKGEGYNDQDFTFAWKCENKDNLDSIDCKVFDFPECSDSNINECKVGFPESTDDTKICGDFTWNCGNGDKTLDCTMSKSCICGDGEENDDEEDCDNGPSNGVDGNGDECTPSGEYNSECTYCTDSCKEDTVLGPHCGDGDIQQDEEDCDPKNTINCTLECEDDSDADSWPDSDDNCPNDSNPDQVDTDDDGVGDECDNCQNTNNPDQVDTDGDGIGDKCEDGGDTDTVSETLEVEGLDITLDEDTIYIGKLNYTGTYSSFDFSDFDPSYGVFEYFLSYGESIVWNTQSEDYTLLNGDLDFCKKKQNECFIYVPELNFNGNFNFNYNAIDENLISSNNATVTITVEPVNDPPVAEDDNITLDGESVVINIDDLLSNDTDVEDGIVDFKKVEVGVQSGTLVISEYLTSFTYTPDGTFDGTDSFTYLVEDLDGEASKNAAKVTIKKGSGDAGSKNCPVSISGYENYLVKASLYKTFEEYLNNTYPDKSDFVGQGGLFDDLATNEEDLDSIYAGKDIFSIEEGKYKSILNDSDFVYEFKLHLDSTKLNNDSDLAKNVDNEEYENYLQKDPEADFLTHYSYLKLDDNPNIYTYLINKMSSSVNGLVDIVNGEVNFDVVDFLGESFNDNRGAFLSDLSPAIYDPYIKNLEGKRREDFKNLISHCRADDSTIDGLNCDSLARKMTCKREKCKGSTCTYVKNTFSDAFRIVNNVTDVLVFTTDPRQLCDTFGTAAGGGVAPSAQATLGFISGFSSASECRNFFDGKSCSVRNGQEYVIRDFLQNQIEIFQYNHLNYSESQVVAEIEKIGGSSSDFSNDGEFWSDLYDFIDDYFDIVIEGDDMTTYSLVEDPDRISIEDYEIICGKDEYGRSECLNRFKRVFVKYHLPSASNRLTGKTGLTYGVLKPKDILKDIEGESGSNIKFILDKLSDVYKDSVLIYKFNKLFLDKFEGSYFSIGDGGPSFPEGFLEIFNDGESCNPNFTPKTLSDYIADNRDKASNDFSKVDSRVFLENMGIIDDINSSPEDIVEAISDKYEFSQNKITLEATNDLVCFPAGSKILIGKGNYSNIEDIKNGDSVVCKNQQTGKQELCEVYGTKDSLAKGVYEINNGEFEVTGGHLFWIKKKNGKTGWGLIVPSKSLVERIFPTYLKMEEGDFLMDESNKWIEIKSINYKKGSVRVYNFKTKKYNNYYSEGYLVYGRGGVKNENSKKSNLSFFSKIKKYINF